LRARGRLIAVLLVAAVVAAVGAGCGKRGETASAKAAPAEDQPAGGIERVGSPNAPVQIRAYYPLNSDHKFIADYLKTLPDKYGGKVSVEIFDMQTNAGRKAWQETGLSCAALFVNGSSRYQVERDGKTQTVDFIKRMGIYWTEEDLEAVIHNILAKGKGGQSGK